jgi:hypothetical protein
VKGLEEEVKEMHMTCCTITGLTLYCHCAADEWYHHFLYLVRSQEQVLASQVLPARSETLLQGGTALLFPGSVQLSGLYSDFKVTLEIYTLQTNREVLPHEVKYHISGKKVCSLRGLLVRHLFS